MSIYNDDQYRIKASSADQNLIEALVSISIHIVYVVDARQTQRIQI